MLKHVGKITVAAHRVETNNPADALNKLKKLGLREDESR